MDLFIFNQTDTDYSFFIDKFPSVNLEWRYVLFIYWNLILTITFWSTIFLNGRLKSYENAANNDYYKTKFLRINEILQLNKRSSRLISLIRNEI